VVNAVLGVAPGRVVVVDDGPRVVLDPFAGRVVVVVDGVVNSPNRARVVVDGRALGGLRS
jgi:hypothetical protein